MARVVPAGRERDQGLPDAREREGRIGVRLFRASWESSSETVRIGVKAATGQILFFVPSDALLPADYDTDILEAFADSAVFAGSFAHAGYPSSWSKRIAREHWAIDNLEDRVVDAPSNGSSALKRELLTRLSALREMTR